MSLSADCLPLIPDLTDFDAQAARDTLQAVKARPPAERLLCQALALIYHGMIFGGRSWVDLYYAEEDRALVGPLSEVSQFLVERGFKMGTHGNRTNATPIAALPGPKKSMQIPGWCNGYPQLSEITADLIASRHKAVASPNCRHMIHTMRTYLLAIWIAALAGNTRLQFAGWMIFPTQGDVDYLRLRGFEFSKDSSNFMVMAWGAEPAAVAN